MNDHTESPRDAARRLFARQIAEGYAPDALHPYADENAEVMFYRARLRHADKDKLIRPMYLNGKGWTLGEPPAPEDGKLLYLLPELLHADPGALVYVVEGEKCADALSKLGLVATTSGSATSAEAANWSPLRGRAVVIWPDHDPSGAKYAEAVSTKLRGLAARVETLDVSGLALQRGGDCVDWLAANPNATADHVCALPRVVVRDNARPAPEPLRRPIPPAEPYPMAELGDVLRPAAESLKRVIQAPDAIIGGSLLAAASLAAQAHADVFIDGRHLPLSLWLLSVAESGERKSAVDTKAMRAAREYEREIGRNFETASEQHTAAMAEWTARCESAKGDAKKTKGQGLADKLRDIGPAPPAPLIPRVIVADFTAEGMFKLLDAGYPSIGAFTDEAAQVFGGHGMTKETVMRTAGAMCRLWDRGELDRVRAGDGAQKLHGRRLALHLLAQPVIAERALSDEVLSGQGFLARCLLAWPEGTAGGRMYRAENLRSDPALRCLADTLLMLHRRPMPVNEEGQRQELAPRALQLSADAFKVWRELHDTVEKASGKGGRFAQVKPWASKTPEQALRIAGVLTLTETPDAQQIEAATIERAAELALWHLNEAARLAGTAELSADVRDAEALLEWVHATGRTFIHSRVALQFGPARIRERERFRDAMTTLEQTGWAEPVAGGMPLDGAHRRHVWRITPASEGR